MDKLEIFIDGTHFTSCRRAHSVMKKAFAGYEYYGNNLDALHDVLTSIRRDAVITVDGLSSASDRIGEYADMIRTVFEDSADENPHLTVIFPEDGQ